MYVCICNAIKESELRDAVQRGARDAAQAYDGLGAEVCCAQCLDVAQDIVDEELKACLQAS